MKHVLCEGCQEVLDLHEDHPEGDPCLCHPCAVESVMFLRHELTEAKAFVHTAEGYGTADERSRVAHWLCRRAVEAERRADVATAHLLDQLLRDLSEGQHVVTLVQA